MPEEALGGISIIVILVAAIFVIFLAVLWCILPFAIFGTKPRLDRLIRVLEVNTNNQVALDQRLVELIRLQRLAQGLPEADAQHDTEPAAKVIGRPADAREQWHVPPR